MGQFSYIIVRIVIDHAHIVLICQITLVHHERITPITRNIRRQQRTLSNLIPTSGILSTNSMPLKQHLILVPQFNPLNVDSIPTNRNTIPSTTHGTIGRSPRLLQPHLLHLNRRRSNGRLLENGTNTLSGIDGIAQDLIIRLITGFAGEIVRFPGRGVKVWCDPFGEEELCGVVGHFFSGDVDHWGGFDFGSVFVQGGAEGGSI
mmetsp:Transcript_15019/g.32581  ORF Transcript_15019/g.32581 Transcript_15019/m.32581 type:complete len:204 (+) Transcript_15019:1082-1693(+)